MTEDELNQLRQQLGDQTEENRERLQRYQVPLNELALLGERVNIIARVLATDEQMLLIDLQFQRLLSQILDKFEELRNGPAVPPQGLLIPSGTVPDLEGKDIQGSGRNGGLRAINGGKL